MNGIIFQAGDKSYQSFFDITSPAAKKYAQIINCDYKLFLNKDENLDRHISWYKIFILIGLLQKYDWVFLLDGDALILNFDINITKCLSSNHHIYACSDGISAKYFNAGAIMFKSTSLTKHFVENVINTPYTQFHHDRNWEQNAMHAEIDENPSFYEDKIKVFPAHLFNHDGKFIFHPAFQETLTDNEKLAMLKHKKDSDQTKLRKEWVTWIEQMLSF